MAASPDDEVRFETIGIEARDRSRYADVRVDEEEVLIYDTETEAAWIQSDSALGLEFMV